MTYLKFTFWLAGLYFIYYVIIILWDLLKPNTGGLSKEGHELTFAETITPVQPEYQLSMDDVKSPMIASGGVSLKHLFNLAQEEKIEYTSQVSF